MHFGMPGTINSSVSSQGITVMAASPKKIIDKADDTAWEEIFESLIIENEPPTRYIKNVIIQTKDGSVIKVSGKHFAEIIEQERELDPDQCEIRSCKMSINFPRLRADVDAWAAGLFDTLNTADQFKMLAKPSKKKTKSSRSKKSQ
jgi:hypothetical protein